MLDLLFTYVIAVAAVVSSQEISISITPETARVFKNTPIQFICKSSVRSNWRSTFFFVPLQGQAVQTFFKNGADCGISSAVDIIEKAACDLTTGQFSITIKSITTQYHDKFVKCKVQYGNGSDSDIKVDASSKVYVKIPLTSIKLSSSLNIDVLKDEVRSFNCQAVSRPDTNITWKKIDTDNVRTNLSSYQLPVIGTTVTSYMNYTGNVSDNGAKLYCQGQYDNITKESNATTLQIIYAPDTEPKIQMSPNGNIFTGDYVKLTCTVLGGNPIPVLFWNCTGTKTNNITGNTASYSVEFNATKTNNNMVCACNVFSHPVVSYRPSVYQLIVVFYPPDTNLLIQQRPPEHIIAGNDVTLTCMVSGGNPLAKLSWNCTGVNSTKTAGIVVSTSISFNTNKTFNNMICACSATHFIASYKPVQEHTLVVYYAPTGSPSIHSEPAENITVGSYVTLRCMLAGGNPLAILSWNCTGNYTRIIQGTTMSNSVGFTVNKTYNDLTCTCIATHAVGSYRHIVHHTLVVYYGPGRPSIQFTPKGPWFEGNDTNLLCFFDDGNPKAKIRWKNGNNTLQSNDDKPILEFNSITRNDNGISIVCSVQNTYADMVSTAVFLDVQYFPSIMVDKQHILTNESKSISLLCNASGNPVPNITWTIPRNEVTSPRIEKSLLIIENINRTDSGNYTCKATSISIEYGNLVSTIDTMVVVNYAPDVTVTKDVSNITENTNLTVSCNASGKPSKYAYLWTHTFAGKIIRVFKSYTNKLVLTNVSYKDIGKYECSVNNGIEDRHGILDQRNNTDVEVQFKPFFVLYDKVTLGKTGSSVNVSVDFIAFPNIEKTVKWRNLTNNSILEDGLNIFMSLKQKNITAELYGKHVLFDKYGYTSSLNFLYFDGDEDGFYNFEVYNSVGMNNITLRIILSDRPEPPKLFSASVIGSSSVTLTWKEGFNGGNNQTFIITYWDTFTADKTFVNVTERKDKTYEMEVSDLIPSTSYTFHINAKNVEGYSENVNNTIVLSTKDITETVSSVIGPVAGAVGGIAAGGLLLVGILLFRRKHRAASRKKTDRKNLTITSPDEGNEDGLKDNELYVSAGDDFRGNTASAGDVYAVIRKPNEQKPKAPQIKETELYAEVLTKKDKQKTEEVSKNVTKNQTVKPIKKEKLKKEIGRNGDVYENITKQHTNSTPQNRNKDGLVYAELVFNDDGKQKFIIRGIDNKTDYADIDLNLKADPLPSDESDEENENNTANDVLNIEK